MAQIREFESTTESYFILDGVSYPKVYEAMLDNGYSDTKIKLVGTNRDTTPLVFSTQYTNIRVDGDSFDTALEAISRLNQILFSKGGDDGLGSIEEAPIDGKQYIRQDGIWVEKKEYYIDVEVARYKPATPYSIINQPLVTGLDLTKGDKLHMVFADDASSMPWQIATMKLPLLTGNTFFIWNYDNAYLTGVINDQTTGSITFNDATRATELQEIWITKRTLL